MKQTINGQIKRILIFDFLFFFQGRAWYYLQCTQAGLFTMTDSFTWLPNRIPIEAHINTCQDVLGSK